MFEGKYKTALFGLMFGLFFCTILAIVITKATIQAEGTPSTPPPISKANEASSFTFQAAPDSNLTLYARRSILLYADDKNKLSSAQVIAAENHLVNELGSTEIDVNQIIIIAQNKVKGAIAYATSLSSAELENWDYYASIASFNLEYLKPITSPGKVSTSDEQNSSTTTPFVAPSLEATKKPNSTEKKVPSYWWVIAGALSAFIYYKFKEE